MTPSPAGSLEPAGPVAAEIADLWWWMFSIGSIVYVAVVIVLVAALVRRGRDKDASEIQDGARLTPGPWIIGGGVVLPGVVLAVVLGLSIDTMRSVPHRPANDALVVEVIGHQWWWEIRYPGYDFATANEVHIPLDRPVEFRVTSADVIHSFWVPALGGKIDALPERVNSLVLEADQTGSFRGACAEFCGLQHARMGLLVVAEPPGEFAQWAGNQQLAATVPTDPEAEAGREAFLDAGCSSCHTVRGTRADGTQAPDLTHLASRQSLAAATIPNDRDHLREWLADPDHFKEGTQMRAVTVSDEQLTALVSYLESLE